MKKVNPIFLNVSTSKLCCSPYTNHNKGCPNFNKKKGCPPHTKRLDGIFDFLKPVYIIWNIFNFKAHTDKMKSLHPDWSKRQIECCLYWQGTARKHLNEKIKRFEFENPDYHIIRCPEAYGINVTETMKQVDEYLEWSPVTKTYQVAMAGILTIPTVNKGGAG